MGPKSQKKSGAKHSSPNKKSKVKTKGKVSKGDEKEDLNDHNSIDPAEPNNGGSNEESEFEEGEVEEDEISQATAFYANSKESRKALLIELLADNQNSRVMENFPDFLKAQDLADSHSSDLNTNVDAYHKWESERDEQRSKSSQISATSDQNPVSTKDVQHPYSSNEDTLAFLEKSGSNNRGGKTPDSETERAFHALLQALGKASFSIDTRQDIEKFTRFLKAQAGVPYTIPQLQAIYNLLLTPRVKSQITTTLLDIGLPTGEKKPYHSWRQGNWYDGGDKTATIKELYVFCEEVLHPRSDPATNSEETLTVRLQSELQKVVRTITSPKFLTENNRSPAAAVETLVTTFKDIESSNEMKQALEDPEIGTNALNSVYNDLTFKEKTDHHAKNFMNHLRNEEKVDDAFESFDNLKGALLTQMRMARDAIQRVAQLLNASIPEMHSLMGKLGNKQVRSDLLQNNSASKNDRDRKPPVQQNDKHKAKGNGTAPNPNSRTITQHNEDEPCKRCGMLKTKHGEDMCPFLVQKHPNANSSNKPWKKSDAGIAALQKGFKSLAWQKNIDGSDFPMVSKQWADAAAPGAKRSTPNQSGNGESHNLTHIINGISELEGVQNLPNASAIAPQQSKIINPFLTTRLINLINREGGQAAKDVKTVLVDTGAIDSNYINSRLCRSLEKSYGVIRMPDVREVKTPDRSASKFYTEGSVNLEIEIYNEIEKCVNAIKVKALIIDSPIDLIIGLPTIRDNNLLLKCMNQILWGN